MTSYKGSKDGETKPQKLTCTLTYLSLVPPESLFSGAITEEKKELLELYFSGVKKIVEIAYR